MDVGVRELKARLSEYLDRVEKGETIRVTDRGKPKALLAPLPGPLRIEEGIAEGWVSPGNGEALAQTRRRFSVDATVQEMLDDDRGR